MAHTPDLSKMKKVCFQKEIKSPMGLITVEGPVTPAHLGRLMMDDKLKTFRAPDLQLKALQDIAALPEGRIVIGRMGQTIVGYVTFHYPDEFERWGEADMPELLEMGAIEVAPVARGVGLARTLLTVAFLDDAMEDFIVISTEYYWHWDLEGTKLSVWEYKDVMEKVLGTVNLRPVGTDEPEICSHPANSLMMRVGSRVDQASVEKFDNLRYRNRWHI